MKILAGLLLVAALGCYGDSRHEPLDANELEALLRAAAECSPPDRCVVVDTYCCPRAVNARFASDVNDALSDAEVDPQDCLADCAGPASELKASCQLVEGESVCRIDL